MDVYESFLKNPFGPKQQTVLVTYTQKETFYDAENDLAAQITNQDLRKVPTSILREIGVDNNKGGRQSKPRGVLSDYAYDVTEKKRKILSDITEIPIQHSNTNSQKDKIPDENQEYFLYTDSHYYRSDLQDNENEARYPDLFGRDMVKTFMPEKVDTLKRLYNI